MIPSSIAGESYSYVVRNGDTVTAIRCISAWHRDHRWKAFRVEGNCIGPPIDVAEYVNAIGMVSFTVDDAVNTGLYYCVDAEDEQTIYDQYIILTEGECIAAELVDTRMLLVKERESF